jgi:hypothetical protein
MQDTSYITIVRYVLEESQSTSMFEYFGSFELSVNGASRFLIIFLSLLTHFKHLADL